jgi:hypothetical protein
VGIRTDFVVADPADADRVCAPRPTAGRFRWFRTKGVTEDRVAALRAAAFGQPFDPTAPWPGTLLRPLALRGAEGPAVFQVPADLAARLAELDEAGLEAVARRWAAGGAMPPEGARAVVAGLADLCRRAARQGKAVLLSVCL